METLYHILKNMDNNYEERKWSQYDFENSVETATQFKYPEEPDSEQFFNIDNNAVIIRLTTLIFNANKPKATLAALLYASGVDVGLYLNCKNEITAIATKLGESKQAFSLMIDRVRKEFELKHTNTGKTSSCKSKYREANKRKMKYAD